jgi:hypothetical protein
MVRMEKDLVSVLSCGDGDDLEIPCGQKQRTLVRWSEAKR